MRHNIPLSPLGDLQEPERSFHLTRDSGVLLRVQILLRWLAIFGQGAAVIFVLFVLGFRLPVIETTMVIGLSVLLNLWLILRYSANHRLSVGAATLFLAYDLVQLEVLLYLTGGLSNPFSLLILAPVTISATVLTAGATWLLVGLAAVLTTLLGLYHQPLPWQGASPELPELYLFGTWVSLLLGLGFISSYVWRISYEGRRMTAATAALQQVLAREHRLSALDGFAAAAAHQLGTPLSTISLIAKELQTSPLAEGEYADDLTSLQTEAQRCREILTSLTADSDQSDSIFAQMKLSALIEDVINEAGDPNIQITRNMTLCDAEEPLVRRQPEIIYGLGNLVENAAEFATSEVIISVTQTAQNISIRIEDDGTGFAPDVLARLGEPWLTTRPAHNNLTAQSGMGLGFFIAKTMLERTGARLTVVNKKPPHQGAVVMLDWSREALEIKPETAN